MTKGIDSLKTRQALEVNGRAYQYFSLAAAGQAALGTFPACRIP